MNASKIAREWTKLAGETVKVEEIGGAFYGFCSELGSLRLLKAYRNVASARSEFSKNLNSFFYTMEFGA